MSRNMKILLGVVLAAIVVMVAVDREPDLGDQIEEAANDAGRAIEDGAEELEGQ
ncbi:hypothetical protein [Kordiimonas sp.]|uniref:hypothetical protein n=1 Tax=Kordiimonas sp. TaxID=1970157 RepID=UPI003A8E9D33